jgi:hypothetical protein
VSTRLALAWAGYTLLYQAITVIRIDQTLLGVLDGFAQFGIGNTLFLGKPDKPLALVDSQRWPLPRARPANPICIT